MIGKDGRSIAWALAVLAALAGWSAGPAAAQTSKSALTRLPELSHLEANRALAAKLNKRGDFHGICLPRERLWDEKFPDQLAKDFLRWYEANPDAAGQRAPASIFA